MGDETLRVLDALFEGGVDESKAHDETRYPDVVFVEVDTIGDDLIFIWIQFLSDAHLPHPCL